MQLLLKEALNYVVFIPWSTGTMFHFEKELYDDELPPEQWNTRWWELAAKYQGIAPPTPRATSVLRRRRRRRTSTTIRPYYDYALSYVLLFQLHDHIARQDPARGSARDELLRTQGGGRVPEVDPRAGRERRLAAAPRDATGADLSAQAMLRYFEPLMEWLKEQNKGRKSTLPDL